MQAGFDSEKCKTYVNKVFEESVVPSLETYIGIQNLSRAYDKCWDTNGKLEEAAEHIQKWVKDFGLKDLVTTEVLKYKDKNGQFMSPLVYTQIKGTVPDFTILFYGHYDKQPYTVDDWDSPKHPFIPYRDPKTDRLYGRGSADDGYSTYSSMLAVKAVQEQGLPTPRIVMLTEGDEESGNFIDEYIEQLKDRIGTPQIIFCLDSGALDYNHLFITKSLRGYIGATLKSQVLDIGVHSGEISGVIPAAYRVLNLSIGKLEDVKTGIINDKFTVNVPPNRYEEVYTIVSQLGDQAIKDFPLYGNTEKVTDDNLELVLNRTWRPQLTVTSINGYPPISEAGNVSQPWLEAKLSLRVPPTLNVEQAQTDLKNILETNPPYQSSVTVSNISGGSGWNCPDYEEWLTDIFDEAGQLYFETDTMSHGEGGSIPLMGLLSDLWPNAQFVVTGVLGPESNAHGPNEFLDIPYCKKLTQCMAHVVAKSVDHLKGGEKKKGKGKGWSLIKKKK